MQEPEVALIQLPKTPPIHPLEAPLVQQPEPPHVPIQPPEATPIQPPEVPPIQQPEAPHIQNRRQDNWPGLQLNYHGTEQHNLGPMTQECRWCKALYYVSEAASNRSFNKCCRSGSIILERMPLPHPLL